ncbi:MAG: SCO family protein [Phycisphaerales bacterium]|nr:SCO family protein [Phycisphaerales bacterium]MDP6986808.1 SCO family protein [Phycisphaerales bacterium]
MLRPIRCAATCLIIGGAAHSASAQILADELPAELDGVGIVQRLDAPVPADLSFVDHTGKDVVLGDLIVGQRPIILTLNYYNCPMLCSLTLNGMVDGLRDVDLQLGVDYDIVTVSINPEEGPELAAQNRKGYLAALGQETPEEAWPFLTGTQKNIEALAKGVGFGYRFDERSGDYAHTASITFVTPDGRISKYMNDVVFPPRDLRLAMVDASQGRIGGLIDTLLLFNCFQWDPEAGSYVPSAWKIMRLAGIITVVLIVAGVLILHRMGRRGSQGGTGMDQTYAAGMKRTNSADPSGPALQTGGLQA